MIIPLPFSFYTAHLDHHCRITMKKVLVSQLSSRHKNKQILNILGC